MDATKPEEVGHRTAMTIPDSHFVLGTKMTGPFPGYEVSILGMGCFWGLELRVHRTIK